MSIGFTEVLLILLLALLLFGAKRLPELARSLGKAVKEFKTGINGLDQSAPSAPPAPDGKPGQSQERHEG
jgi:sec-independent protein translocase protein TatA